MSVQNTIIIPHFGVPDEAYQSKYCEIWHIQNDFPWMVHVINSGTGQPLVSALINSEFKKKLFVAFTTLFKDGLHTEIKTWDGCYNQRDVRGMNTASLHAWAMAVDLNAATEKMQPNGTTHWSNDFLSVMKGAGLYWGGEFTHRFDPMHFALYNG